MTRTKISQAIFNAFSGRIRRATDSGVRADLIGPNGTIADFSYFPSSVHAVRWLSTDIRIDATRIENLVD